MRMTTDRGLCNLMSVQNNDFPDWLFKFELPAGGGVGGADNNEPAEAHRPVGAGRGGTGCYLSPSVADFFWKGLARDFFLKAAPRMFLKAAFKMVLKAASIWLRKQTHMIWRHVHRAASTCLVLGLGLNAERVETTCWFPQINCQNLG